MRYTICLLTIVAVLLSVKLVHAQQQAFPCVGEVTSNAINIRCDSTAAGKIICSINEHDIINITSEAFEWYKIKLPKNAPCFISAKYVNIVQQGSFGMTNADSVNLRVEPNESSCILGRINKDKVVNIVEKQGDWYRITPPDTARGWINKKFVKVLVSAQTAAASAAPIETKPGQEKPAVKSEGPAKDSQVTVIGIVEPYGKIIGRKGTHKITTEDKKTYILKGDKKTLNSCSYRKAAIRGTSQDIPGQPYPVISVENIEVLN